MDRKSMTSTKQAVAEESKENTQAIAKASNRSTPAQGGSSETAAASGQSRQRAQPVAAQRKPIKTKKKQTLCELNLRAMAQRGFLVPQDGRSQLASEMRRIKRPLLLDVKKHAVEERAPGAAPANIIMLTSALPGEGKTYTSTNLAVSIASELDRSVILVDGDVAKRDLSRQFGLLDFAGFADCLRPNGLHPDEVTLKTNVPRLEIMPCGTQSDNIDELYASKNMTEVITQLARDDVSRIVLIDGPPILVTTEAAVLARSTSQAILVVEANKTPQDAINHALTPLLDHPCVRLVLNKTTRGLGGSYGYGYGYGYSYGDGGADVIE